MAEVLEPRSWDEVPVVSADSEEDLLETDHGASIALVKEHGAVLFRSFSVGIDRFRSFVQSYSNRQVAYPGRRRRSVSRDGSVQTVDIGADALPLHSELSHSPFRPDLCWFYCVRAPDHGSETTLCDGALLASALPASAQAVLDTASLRYRRTTSVAFLEQLLGTTDAGTLRSRLEVHPGASCYEILGDEIRQDFVAPALHTSRWGRHPVFANNIIHNWRPGTPLRYPTFADGATIPEPLIVDIAETAKRHTLEIEWRDEDLLMVDNTRMMHGRRTITDPHRTVWTQFSDAGF